MSKSWLQMLAAAGVAATVGTAAPERPAVAAPQPPYRSLVILGDSLSDTGNAGRFSDGPVWVEVLAERLGAVATASQRGGANYAVGGARLHGGAQSLRAQADRYLGTLPPSGAGAGTLHVVFGGGNDLLAAPFAPNKATLVPDAVGSLRGILDDLAAHGARAFLVPNLPDIGVAPQVAAFGPQVRGLARTLSREFNRALAAVLDGFVADQRRLDRAVTLHRLDVWALAETVMADPAAAGFRDVTRPCPGRGACDGHLFWDGLHPTARAHARLAGAALELVGAGAQVR